MWGSINIWITTPLHHTRRLQRLWNEVQRQEAFPASETLAGSAPSHWRRHVSERSVQPRGSGDVCSRAIRPHESTALSGGRAAQEPIFSARLKHREFIREKNSWSPPHNCCRRNNGIIHRRIKAWNTGPVCSDWVSVYSIADEVCFSHMTFHSFPLRRNMKTMNIHQGLLQRR